ncbi:hypothetical protein [Vibrio breoganii]|uniref:hypothetical protein n=1 Tax=Vibrio breoganii TaxID=553239 RepID=UPI000C85F666|nr:hypothetical protein [Vibrio breoganii]PML13959.1 hypothetical protein BCT84_12425 [Vibrio breoganii]
MKTIELKHYIQKGAANSVKIRPNPGQKFSREQLETIKELTCQCEEPNLSAYISNNSYVHVIAPRGQDYDAMVEHIESVIIKPLTQAQIRANAAKLKREKIKAEQEAEQTATFANNRETIKKLTDFFGEDNWNNTNEYNRNGIIRFVLGLDRTPNFILNRALGEVMEAKNLMTDHNRYDIAALKKAIQSNRDTCTA